VPEIQLALDEAHGLLRLGVLPSRIALLGAEQPWIGPFFRSVMDHNFVLDQGRVKASAIIAELAANENDRCQDKRRRAAFGARGRLSVPQREPCGWKNRGAGRIRLRMRVFSFCQVRRPQLAGGHNGTLAFRKRGRRLCEILSIPYYLLL
jgi:hypothetical protein